MQQQQGRVSEDCPEMREVSGNVNEVDGSSRSGGASSPGRLAASSVQISHLLTNHLLGSELKSDDKGDEDNKSNLPYGHT